MAVVNLTQSPYTTRWPPGTEQEFWIGPADIFRHSTITVTPHAYEPTYEKNLISVLEVKIEERPPGEVIVYVRMRNSGTSTIRSFYLYVSTVGA